MNNAYSLALKGMLVFLILFIGSVIFHIAFLVALSLLGIFFATTCAFLAEKKLLTKPLLILFAGALLVFFAVSAVIHYADLYPFGGGQGDQPYYHNAALLISNDIKEGNFTWERAFNQLVANDASKHTYPLFIGALYAVSIPDQFVGKALNIWVASLSILLLYFLAKELGAKEKWAITASVFGIAYPSYLYFNSLLIRESIVAALVLGGVLMMLKLLKEFSWKGFLLFVLLAVLLTHFRFYIGLVLLIAFGLSWMFGSRLEFKTRMSYAVILLPLLGLIPQMFNHGYYGAKEVYYYFHPDQIVNYRSQSDAVLLKKKAITGAVPKPEAAPGYEIPVETPRESALLPWVPRDKTGEPGSALVREPSLANPIEHPVVFARDYAISSASVVLGPSPLSLRFFRQLITLMETVPWLFVFFLSLKGVIGSKKRLKDTLPLMLVAVGIILLVALFLNTYGTYMRIRIPAFLLLMAISALGMQSFSEKRKT